MPTFFISVATIGGNVIYRIEDTAIYPVSNMASKPTNPDEGRYVCVGHLVHTVYRFMCMYVRMTYI